MAQLFVGKGSSEEETLLSSNLIRWSGLAAMLGGVMWMLLVPLITLTYPGRTGWGPKEVIFSLVWEDYNKRLPTVLLLLAVGLAGLGVRYGQRSGGLGRAGFVVALFGLGLMLLGNVVEFWVAGGIREGVSSAALGGWMSYSLGYLLLSAGLVLVGIAALREKVLPYGNVVPLILGLLSLPVFFTVTSGVSFGTVLAVIFGLGWVLLGYTLWSERGEPIQRPVRVR
jgi:hypothetical protein